MLLQQLIAIVNSVLILNNSQFKYFKTNYLVCNCIFFRYRLMHLDHCIFYPMELIAIFTELREFHNMWQNLDTIHLFGWDLKQ